MKEERHWAKRFTPAKTFLLKKEMKSTNLWIYLYFKPELVINTSLDRTLAEVNEVTIWFGISCESAKGPEVLHVLLEQLEGWGGWGAWGGDFIQSYSFGGNLSLFSRRNIAQSKTLSKYPVLLLFPELLSTKSLNNFLAAFLADGKRR